MSQNWTQLIPFPSKTVSYTDLSLRATAHRTPAPNSILHLEYQLRGAGVADVLFPHRANPWSKGNVADRKEGLWKHTCFEVFLGIPGAQRYWELNLSPSGEWNFYRFANYRHGQEIEKRITPPQIVAQMKQPDLYSLTASIDITEINELSDPHLLSLGISCVIEMRDQNLSYWAIQHNQVKPDFHLRETFVFHI